MSGGHWNHDDRRAAEILREIGGDPVVRDRWPVTSATLPRLADALERILHDADWDLSGDSSIDNDVEFDARAFKDLLDAIMWPWAEARGDGEK